MPGLADIEFATDTELGRYEQEILDVATEHGLDLDRYRALAVQRLKLEAIKDGIDPAGIVDDGADRALAMRDYMTLTVLYLLWRDLSTGRESANTTIKAQLAAQDLAVAADLFKLIGWPLASANVEVTDRAHGPRLIRMTV